MSRDNWIEAALSNPFLVEEIYQKHAANPNSVDSSWHFAFTGQEPKTAQSVILSTELSAASAASRISHLIEAYRTYGHLQAQVNPIQIEPIEETSYLKLETLGFKSEELTQQFPTCGFLPKEMAPLQEIIEALKKTYCGKIGVEYMGVENPELEKWLQQQIEPNQFKIKLTVDQRKMIFQQLNRSELLESFIHTKYTGQKRFSIEGGETLIPMLEAVIEIGSQLGAEEFFIGMAHRGRLNVLSNILNKSHAEVFAEFEEGYISNTFEGSGDVKYHKGFYSEVSTPEGKKVRITLPPNPSHLEAVDPVLEGQVKAKQVLDNSEGVFDHVIPILIHGDAAIAGQGVVYETMQLYRIPGYATGGTLHIVINNQIGFTAIPEETRSTLYCTDIAKAFSAPVFHVNGEDPEGAVYATILAMQIRKLFHCDVFLDLNCYRKYGHNESDEPAYTQPLEYQIIRKKKPIREMYRDQLIQEGVLEKQVLEELEKEFNESLQEALKEAKAASTQTKRKNKNEVEKESFHTIDTKVSKKVLVSIAERISAVPDGLTIHPKLYGLVMERLSMIKGESKPIDWGTAELLAYGSILWEGISIRLSGQDSKRGTFSHRHAVWVDQKMEKVYVPLSNLKPDQGRFDVINSPLSEYASVGFEFGYSVANPKALVIWEAQFGDFCNGAQILIDQFISTTEQKWGQKASVVLLLPHGYEGQGPEHSSGRMERFLALAGEDNMRIVNPTTPAQLFHLFRRQAIAETLKPLIVFTPKGLLRHPACVSTLSDLTDGSFSDILDDPEGMNQATRLVFCSGRIYYDLIAERKKRNIENLAIVRIEQLYPLDTKELKKNLKKYKKCEEYLWVQEEPINMGAWTFIHPRLNELLSEGSRVKYIGRQRSASPAVGSYAMHKKQYETIMTELFG